MLTRLLIIFCFTTLTAIWIEAVRTALLTMTGGYIRHLDDNRQKRAQGWMQHRAEFAVTIRGISSLLTSAWSVLSFDIIFIEQEQTLFTSRPAQSIAFIGSIMIFALLKESLGSNWLSMYRSQLLFRTMFIIELIRKLFFPYVSFIIHLSTRLKNRENLVEIVEVSDEDEILSLVESNKERGGDLSLESDEKRMIKGIFNLGDRNAREVMTPRKEVIAIDIESSKEAIFQKLTETNLSRVPVYRETIDKIVGILYAKDFIDYEKVKVSTTNDLMHKPVFINEDSLLDDLLENFRRKKIHFAVVQDDFGGTAGIVTMEDILEEIVGEIRDEFDDEEDCYIWKQQDGSLLLDARAAIYDINELLGTEKLQEDEHDSISALVYAECSFIPEVGKRIHLPPCYEAEILEGDEKGIRKLQLHTLPLSPEEEEI